MRANVTIVVDLPTSLEDFFDGIQRMTDRLEDPEIFRASFVEYSQRDGTPAHISLTIGGDVHDHGLHSQS
jgi:hypothetical protein